MEDRMEFDETLGGNQVLPSGLNLLKFTSARCKEIETLKYSLRNPNHPHKLAFQRLPIHMRRRVMSHNAKRLPQRLRKIHLSQLQKSGMPPKQKRPSRKYRRRPRNLLEDYNRRQKTNTWLETHIWHAKRFHMVNKWGFRIPHRPCDRAFRACYRATSKHCLIQDLSYFSCIELIGDQNVLVGEIKKLCNTGGLSIGAKAYIDGKREGSTTFYTLSSREAIGNVSFQWKPNVKNEQTRVLWIWIHPSYYVQVLDVLIELFKLQTVSTGSISKYCNSQLNIMLFELKHELNRFRLTGPLSQAILNRTFHVVDVSTHTSDWFKDYLENDEHRQIFAEQIEYWKNIKDANSPALVPPHIILSLIVTDPRYGFPKKRMKAMPVGTVSCDFDIPVNMADGPLWTSEVRSVVRSSKLSNSAIAEMRNQLLVPGTDLPEPGAPVPVILIQRPGTNGSGYCSGWDVIIPSGWAQAFWMGLVMWGARSGGLRESESVDFEMGRTHYLKPDTEAGRREEAELSDAAIQKYFKLPPNKRTNFNKFSVVSPFNFNWKMLLNDWRDCKRPEVNDVRVLRDLKMLKDLDMALHKKIVHIHDLTENYLVPVKLTSEGKGRFKMFSLICLPSENDLRLKTIITEPKIYDANQTKRRLLRKNHKTMLKKLKKKRHEAKQTGKKIEIDLTLLKKYQKEMRELWLPSIEKDIKNSCSRPIMGFVTKGDFSFTLGKNCAVGYISIGAIKALLSMKSSSKVLLRNTNSRVYRFAEIHVIY